MPVAAANKDIEFLKVSAILGSYYLNVNNKINNLIIRFTNNNLSYRSSFLLPLILQHIGGDISSESEPLVKYLLSITILCVIVLTCFINAFGYIFSLHLIPKFELGFIKKYPIFKILISLFEKSSFFLIIIQIIIGFAILSSVIILNTLLILYLKN